MTTKAHLAELDRQHKALDHEIAEALAHSSTDDLEITELKRRTPDLGPSLGAFNEMHRDHSSNVSTDLWVRAGG